MSLLDALADAAALRIQEGDLAQISNTQPHKQCMTLMDLSDDLLHHIYAFIPTIDNLRNCTFVNKRASKWISQGKTTEPLFGTAYQLAFGQPAPLTGRNAWKELMYIRQALSREMYDEIGSLSGVHTVGILPPEKETEAIGYDHSRHFFDGQCLGYFGMTKVFPSEEGPLAIWGDFNGIYMVPSIEDLQSPTKPLFSKISGDSQVLTVLATPLAYNAQTRSTTFFLGYASGKVQAVRAVQEGERHSFEVLSTASAHSDEVTSLSILPTNPPCVASSSVDETIIAYPKSLSDNPTLEHATLAYRTNDPATKILGFAGMDDMVCCGDDSGRLTLLSINSEGQPLLQKVTSQMLGVPGTLPTLVKFHHNTIVVGTNTGELHTFEVDLVGDTYSLARTKCALVHNGAIESISFVGNIVLTSSAGEYHLRGCDIRSLKDVGLIAVHPGRPYQPREPGRSQLLLKCAVMSAFVQHEHQSLLCFCRDGSVVELSFAPAKGIEPAASEWKMHDIDIVAPSSGSFPANSDPSLSARVRMSIIQASLQNKKNHTLPFVGADGVMYENTQTAFDRFSGVFPCGACQYSGEGAFSCRIQQKHTGGLDESPSANLFQKLQKSKSSWLSEAEETWTCEPCNVDNKIDKQRCFLCMRWKHGKRYNYPAIRDLDNPDDLEETEMPATTKKKKRKRTAAKALTALAAPEAPVAPVKSPTNENVASTDVEKVGEAPWFCKHCKIENKFDKKRCFSCRRWKGGKREVYTPKYAKKGKGKKTASKTVESTVLSQGSNPGAEVQEICEATWFCVFCQAENNADKQRCSLCWGWKDGTTELAHGSVASAVSDKPVESTVKVMQGMTPGTAKMWECQECFQLNHWRKYSCCSCGKRSGGRALEMSWPSAMETAVVISPSPRTAGRSTSSSTHSSTSSSLAPSHKTRKKESGVTDKWTCHRCSSINHESSLLCSECYASRKSRSSRGRHSSA